MAALLGGADHPAYPDPRVLHSEGTGARDRQGKDAAIILRANAAAGILSENEFKKERVCLRRAGVSRRKTMNNWAADKSVCLPLVAILLAVPGFFLGARTRLLPTAR